MNCIPRGGEVAWTGPSAFEKATLYLFAVKADGQLVHEMLTRYIGQPSQDLGFHIDVRGTTLDHVFFAFLDSERRQRPLDLYEGFDGGQGEQLFAIVTLGYRLHPEPGFVLFAPYVYSSDTPGWRAEREIYGYPQQHGRVFVNRRGSAPADSLSLCARAIKEFATGATSTEQEIVRISRGRRATAGPARKLSATEFVGSIAQRLGVEKPTLRGRRAASVVERPRLGATAADISFCERRFHEAAEPARREPPIYDLAAAKTSGRLPMLFLKQFRDIAYADRACYQAIVEAQLQMEGDLVQVPLDGYELTLADTDSIPIRRELGILGTCDDPVPVEFALQLTVKELAFDHVRVISNPYWNPATEPEREGELTRLPVYVDRGGEAVWRQPSIVYGARIYGFGVTVHTDDQQRELDRCINDVVKRDTTSTYGSRPFELLALRNMALLLFVEYQRISSGTDDDRRLGGVSYREFLAMQLAESRDEEYPEIDWFIPFIYLDADAPRLGGREIFGYPKQLGWIDPFERYRNGAGELEPAKELELSATAFRSATRGNASTASIVRIQGPEEPPAIKRRYVDAGKMVGDLVMVGVRQQMTGIQNALLAGNVGNVFLKQFRDCANPGEPCYQTVCKTDTIPGRFRGGGLIDPSGYTITVQNLASEPLLNYIRGADARDPERALTPVLAYWMDLDFELTNGRVIANPMAQNYAPDLSVGRTRSAATKVPRICRRSGQLEPDTLDDLRRRQELAEEGDAIG